MSFLRESDDVQFATGVAAAIVLVTALLMACKPAVTPKPPAPVQTTESRTEALHIGVGGCAVVLSQNGQALSTLTTDAGGTAAFLVTTAYLNGSPLPGTLNLAASATCPGFNAWVVSWVAALHGNQDVCAGGSSCGPNQGIVVDALVPAFPEPPTRAYILSAHESFQGAVLHTQAYGDLFWWPTAWTSLNDADRAASYAQIASWGDTDITVSWKWDYGEPGQPYGSGQLVPPRDLSGDPATFRALVKDVIQHRAANGQPFVPRIFMSGDDGYDAYMARLPLVLAALGPQPGDSIDLTAFVKLQLCYDSCVPGWAGPTDDKTKIASALLATRAACPTCVVALEFATGYASQGDGGDFFQTPAGQAFDELDFEGNTWPPNNSEQYFEILDRWLGPAYIRPAAQTSDPGAPFSASSPEFYLRNGTPRGPYGVQCFEPYTYDWVRGRIPIAQVPIAFAYMKSLGCPVIDTPGGQP